jgi:hypothetical protein
MVIFLRSIDLDLTELHLFDIVVVTPYTKDRFWRYVVWTEAGW